MTECGIRLEAPKRRDLSTWQEVAAYLGVSVRTAQKWEKTRGLPVHRAVGEKARVRAYSNELEAWGRAEQTKRAVRQDPGRALDWAGWLWLAAAAVAAAVYVWPH